MDDLPNKIYSSTLVGAQNLESGVGSFVFRLTSDMQFKVGQYIWLELPTKTGDTLRRAFSIASVPNNNNEIRIIARKSDSEYKNLLFSLQAGAKANVHGPFGSSFTLGDGIKQLNLIAGGVGIAPFLPILELINKNKLPIRTKLVYFTNDGPDAAFVDELNRLGGNLSDINLEVIQGNFEPAHLTNILSFNPGDSQWWISGSQVMVDHVTKVLLSNNIPRESLVYENYYPTKANDITLDKIVEQTKSENLIVQAIQNSNSHTVITDSNGTVLFANDAALRITGFSREEIIGNTPRLWGGMMSPEFYQGFWHKKVTGQTFKGEVTNRRKNGEVYYAVAHIAPIFGVNKEIIGYIGTEDDITQLKNQELRLDRSLIQFRLATESAKIGVWELDLRTNKLYWDDQTYALYGATRNDGADPEDQSDLRLKHIHPEDLKIVDDLREEALRNKTEYNCAFRVIWNDGSTHYLSGHGTFEYDKNNQPTKLIGVNIDITKDKLVDIAKTEFVSLASHQLRTPLTAIRWNAELLLEDKSLNQDQKSYVDQAYKSVLRMIDLVNSLLNVSRLDLGTLMIEPKQVELVEITKSIIAELGPVIATKKMQLSEQYQADSISYLADEKLIRVVILNLLSNALKYTPAQGHVNISIGNFPIGHKVGQKTLIKDGLVIVVSDNGMGIPVSQADKIFSKLFRADNAQASEAEGTGLGLYIVKQIIDLAGGQIWFESIENQGTAFYVALPVKGMNQKQGLKSLD